jgi:hypothetical protein
VRAASDGSCGHLSLNKTVRSIESGKMIVNAPYALIHTEIRTAIDRVYKAQQFIIESELTAVQQRYVISQIQEFYAR